MRITRICLMAIVVLTASMVIRADLSVPQDCAPGITTAICVSSPAPGSAAPTTVLVSAQTAPKLASASAIVSPRPRGADVQKLGATPPMTEPLSLVLLGMAFVVAAWTLRHAKAG